MSARLSTQWMVELTPSIRSSILLWAIAAFICAFVIWAAFAEVDELARGEGKVIPTQHLQIVQNLEGGIVAEITVAEGDFVDQGQILMRLDDTQFESTFKEKHLTVLELKVRAARLRAEVEGLDSPNYSQELRAANTKNLLREETALFTQRQARLTSSKRVIAQQMTQKQQQLAEAMSRFQQFKDELALAQKELDILTPLVSEGIVSEVELLRARKAKLKASGEVSAAGFKIPQIASSMAELESRAEEKLMAFRSDAQSDLSDILAELPRLTQSSGALADRVNRTLIRSPVKGTVKQLMINTVGGVVQPGMELVSIVPIEDALLIETQVRPADIARLFPGQKARVKFTAYDFSIYGGLDADVMHISADTIANDQGESFYLVRVKTARNYLGSEAAPLPIIPGMIAQVDILTGKKTILDYLLKPIFRAQQFALTER